MTRPEHEERGPGKDRATTSETTSPQSTALDDLDVIHHAWVTGYELGLTHGQSMAVEHLAQELLHRQAAEVAGMAIRTARARHGDHYAAEIGRQASGVDW